MPFKDIPKDPSGKEQVSKVPPPADMLKSKELNTPEKVLSMMKDYAAGALRGATVDLAGGTVDIMNLLISPATKALGIYSEDPVGGSKHLRKLTGQPTEDSPTEMAGSFLTPGGIAKATILSAVRLGKNVDEALAVKNRVTKGMLEAGKTIREAEIAGNAMAFQKEGVYWDKSDTLKMNPKTVVSDVAATISHGKLDVNPDATYNINKASVPLYDLVARMDTVQRAYPELATTNVVKNAAMRTGNASYDFANSRVNLGNQSAPEGLLGTVLHEQQHAIQRADGSKALGTSPEAQRVFTDNTLQRLVQKREELGMRKDWAEMSGGEFADKPEYDALQRYIAKAKLDDSRALVKYLNDPGEQEARFTQQFKDLDQETISNRVLDLIRKGKTPQTWDTHNLPNNPIHNVPTRIKE